MASWTPERSAIPSLMLDKVSGTEIVNIKQEFRKVQDCIASCDLNTGSYYTGSKAEGLVLPGSSHDYIYYINDEFSIGQFTKSLAHLVPRYHIFMSYIPHQPPRKLRRFAHCDVAPFDTSTCTLWYMMVQLMRTDYSACLSTVSDVLPQIPPFALYMSHLTLQPFSESKSLNEHIYIQSDAEVAERVGTSSLRLQDLCFYKDIMYNINLPLVVHVDFSSLIRSYVWVFHRWYLLTTWCFCATTNSISTMTEVACHMCLLRLWTILSSRDLLFTAPSPSRDIACCWQDGGIAPVEFLLRSTCSHTGLIAINTTLPSTTYRWCLGDIACILLYSYKNAKLSRYSTLFKEMIIFTY